MSSPFNAPVRLAVDAPRWAVCLLSAVAIAATAAVAGERHAASEAMTASAAQAAAPAAATTAATTTTAPTVAPPRRAAPVSRSSSRDRRAAPRTAARPRAKRPDRPERVIRSRTLERKPPAPRLPQAASDAGETVAAALRSTYNSPGKCLQWSREQAGIPSRYSDATTAWEHATGRNPADENPPRGAAVYWTGGSSGYGHVAISVGGGRVRSSDAGGSGQVATVPIRQITDDWHLDYAGWANSINGYQIPGVPA